MGTVVKKTPDSGSSVKAEEIMYKKYNYSLNSIEGPVPSKIRHLSRIPTRINIAK